ncbi:MAG: outer membrane protein assembly factor BamD [Nitrospirae bacterium]|nr:outer membrane protein assembly factor BamD [Nitrospirota bacterium]
MRTAPTVINMRHTVSTIRPSLQGILTIILGFGLVVQGCAWRHNAGDTGPSFKNSNIQQAYRDGETAIQQGDFAKARGMLARTISNFPGEDDLAQIQWLIARTYELEGRTEEAVSEYKRFLRNYPDHPNAKDADERIRILETGGTAAAKNKKPVRVTGNISTDYEYAEQISPDDVTTLNRPSQRIDFQVRNFAGGRGKAVVSGTKTFDLLDTGRDDTRIYKLYTQWRNMPDTTSFQFGRQSNTSGGGLWTRYDGLNAGYRPWQSWGLEVSGGFPVDFITQEGVGTDKYFYEAGINLWDVRQTTSRFYFIRQFNDGYLDREAVGGNIQVTRGDFNVLASTDYDFGFGEFNDRFVSLEYHLSEPVHLNVAYDIRKDPYLQLETALQDMTAIEQGVTALADWIALNGEDAVRTMAENNTIDSVDTRFGVRWEVNPVWSTSLDYSHSVSETAQTDGTKEARGLDRYSWYLAEHNHWNISETLSFLFIYQTSPDLTANALYLTASKYFGQKVNLQIKDRIEDTRFKALESSDYIRHTPGIALGVDINHSWNFYVETEYSTEDHSDGTSLSTVWSRFNMTRVF